MKITILTMGTRGDVAPFLALSQMLQRSGHDVTLGADPEITGKAHRLPCPSPGDRRLRLVSLSTPDRPELLAVNTVDTDLVLELHGPGNRKFSWQTAEGRAVPDGASLHVPGRGWIWGYLD